MTEYTSDGNYAPTAEEYKRSAEIVAAQLRKDLRLDEYDVLATQTAGPPDIP